MHASVCGWGRVCMYVDLLACACGGTTCGLSTRFAQPCLIYGHISPCSIKGLQAMAASTVCQVCFGTDLIACVKSQVNLGLRTQSLIYNRPQHEVSRACRERHRHFVNASLLTPGYPGPISKHPDSRRFRSPWVFKDKPLASVQSVSKL